MDKDTNSFVVTVTRFVAASPQHAYQAWLDPKLPGTPWNAASKLLLDVKLDGLFYSRLNDTPHYGRFTKLEKGRELQHSWVSPYTEGHESMVTVTFTPEGKGTRMSLVHEGLPNNPKGEAHQRGWTYFLDLFPQQFETVVQS